MSWRIEQQVVRGEIDNRIPGRLIGKIWLHGREDPLELELEGNPWRDLAGHLLKFTNPDPQPGDLSKLSTHQKGRVSNATASRKVKVPDCTPDELMEFFEAKQPFPWHWQNILYLEWYSVTNGRIVIEATNYQLDLDPEPTWVLTEKEETAQQAVNDEELAAFIEQIGIKPSAPVNDEDDDSPQSIEEAVADDEDAGIQSINDRAHAQLDRDEIDIIDFDSIRAKERIKWLREFGKNSLHLSHEICEMRIEWIERRIEIAAITFEDLEASKCSGIINFDEPLHPLVDQCCHLAFKLYHDVQNAGWVPLPAQDEHPLREVVFRVSDACEQLAGALGLEEDAEEWPPESLVAGYIIVRLKKASNYLIDTLNALDSADEESLATPQWRSQARLEVNGIHVQTLHFLRETRALFHTGEDDDDLGVF
jgi:hypothetical protein